MPKSLSPAQKKNEKLAEETRHQTPLVQEGKRVAERFLLLPGDAMVWWVRVFHQGAKGSPAISGFKLWQLIFPSHSLSSSLALPPFPPPFVSYRKLGQESYLALLKSIRANIQMGQNSEIFTCRLLTTLHCTNAAFSLPPAFLFLLCTLSYMLSTSARWVTGCCIPRQTMGSGVLPLLLTTSNGLW